VSPNGSEQAQAAEQDADDQAQVQAIVFAAVTEVTQLLEVFCLLLCRGNACHR
jgi:hypothetical protein